MVRPSRRLRSWRAVSTVLSGARSTQDGCAPSARPARSWFARTTRAPGSNRGGRSVLPSSLSATRHSPPERRQWVVSPACGRSRGGPDEHPQTRSEVRDPMEGGRPQAPRSFERAGDAEAFELEAKRRKQLGPLASGVIQYRQTLAEFIEQDRWPRYAIPNLAPDTRRRYLEIWGTHL